MKTLEHKDLSVNALQKPKMFTALSKSYISCDHKMNLALVPSSEISNASLALHLQDV